MTRREYVLTLRYAPTVLAVLVTPIVAPVIMLRS